MKQCAFKTIPRDEVQSHRTVHASLLPRPSLALTYFERGIVENKNTSAYALFQHESLEDLCLTEFHLSPVNSSSCSSGCEGFEASLCMRRKSCRAGTGQSRIAGSERCVPGCSQLPLPPSVRRRHLTVDELQPAL